MVKILGISSSPRAAATEAAVNIALEAAERLGRVKTEFLSLRGKKIQNCTHCNYCFDNNTGCIIKDDMVELTEKFLNANGYVIGSPVYTMTVTPQLLSFFNRLRPIRHLYPKGLYGKVGGALTVGGTRNGGQETALSTIINCYLSRGIMVVGGSSGNYAGGKVWSKDQGKEGVYADTIGVASVKDIGTRVAFAARAMKEAEKNIYEYQQLFVKN